MCDLRNLNKVSQLVEMFNEFCSDRDYLEAHVTIKIINKVVVQVYWLEADEDICTAIDGNLERSFEKLYGRFYAWLIEDEDFISWAKYNEVVF